MAVSGRGSEKIGVASKLSGVVLGSCLNKELPWLEVAIRVISVSFQMEIAAGL